MSIGMKTITADESVYFLLDLRVVTPSCLFLLVGGPLTGVLISSSSTGPSAEPSDCGASVATELSTLLAVPSIATWAFLTKANSGKIVSVACSKYAIFKNYWEKIY